MFVSLSVCKSNRFGVRDIVCHRLIFIRHRLAFGLFYSGIRAIGLTVDAGFGERVEVGSGVG